MAAGGPFELPYQFPTFEAPVVLYEGSVTAVLPPGTRVDGECQVSFEWRPTPNVHIQFRSDTSVSTAFDWIGARGRGGPMFELPTTVPPQSVASLWDRGHSATTQFAEGGARLVLNEDSPLEPIGDLGSATEMALTLVNLGDLTDGRHVYLEALGWTIRIGQHPDDATESLRSLGGYGPTHYASLTRPGGDPLRSADYDDVAERLWHFLAFVNGALPGIALPVAIDDTGRTVWAEWRCTTTDRWKARLNWYDTHLADDLPSLFEAWCSLTQDPFWERVLRRVVRMLVSANQIHILDVSLTTGWSALELLAWAVLRVENSWLRPDSGELTASGEVRLLLAWAGIPPEIPATLGDLRAMATARTLADGPAALAWLRNRLTHPPRRAADDWPDADPMFDAWRLELEYVELVVLRLLGHQGRYGSRRYTDGRWWGQLDQVPWAPAHAPNEEAPST